MTSSILSKKPSVMKLGLLVGALVLLFGLLIGVGTQTSYAGTVQIKDDANILSSSNKSSITSSGSSLPFNVRVYTNSSDTNQSTFQSDVSSNAINPGIIYGVSSKLGLTFVVANGIGVDASEATSIANVSTSYFKNGDFTGGINAMFNSTRSYASNGTTSSNSSSTATRSSSSGFPFLGCLIIGIIALVAISIFGAGRRRSMNNSGPGYGGGYGAGYNNNNYGPGYGPNYGPGYGGGYGNQGGGGIGPLGGGVIGAGLGGLAGYELGKEAGRNEAGNYNNGGFGGNSGGSNWGGSNDSGSGGASWGGGSSNDSGFGSGGGSFDAGGGSDWGGGGGDSGGGGGDSGGASW